VEIFLGSLKILYYKYLVNFRSNLLKQLVFFSALPLQKITIWEICKFKHGKVVNIFYNDSTVHPAYVSVQKDI